MKRPLWFFFGVVSVALLAANAPAQVKAPQTKAPAAKLPPQAQTIPVQPIPPATGFRNWGFELGTLEGWTKTGTAFDRQPTFENNVAVRRPGLELNYDGVYWVGTFENRPSASAPLGSTQGDAKTGTLTSPEFTIEKRYISFLLGGGRGIRNEVLEVRLSILGAPDGRARQFKAAGGWDDEQMQRVVWDVSVVRGKRARIEILDQAIGRWGHINVDDFRFSDVAPANPRPEDPPVPATRTARFRVTVNGFVATEQTWDDASQRDGKDDEVFLVGETRTVSLRSGELPRVTTLPQVRSIVMGDIQGFDDRANAGSASALGGIRSGDRVPNDQPWARQRQPGTRALPFILWEGELTAGTLSAVIVPTIWEFDGEEPQFAGLLRKLDGIDELFEGSRFQGVDERTGNRAGASLLKRLSELQIGQNVVGTDRTFERSAIIGIAADRPIGLTWNGTRFGFDPWVLPLTYEKAVDASQTDYGRGPGVIEVNYFDPTELRGRYTLYVQIEQLP